MHKTPKNHRGSAYEIVEDDKMETQTSREHRRLRSKMRNEARRENNLK